MFSLLLACLLVLSMIPFAFAEDDIILGCITTGIAVPTYTEAVTNMSILAAEQINAKGGVLGKNVKMRHQLPLHSRVIVKNRAAR